MYSDLLIHSNSRDKYKYSFLELGKRKATFCLQILLLYLKTKTRVLFSKFPGRAFIFEKCGGEGVPIQLMCLHPYLPLLFLKEVLNKLQ